MHTPRKPLWPKIVATLVVTAMLYPLSWGPMLFFWTRSDYPDWPVMATAYYPVFFLMEDGPTSVGRVLAGYGNWWMRRAKPTSPQFFVE